MMCARYRSNSDKSTDAVGKPRVDPQHVVVQRESGVAALQEVDRTGHRTDVDALARRAALDVFDVAEQRLAAQCHDASAIRSGEDPGMRDPSSGSSHRGAAQVVVDRPGDRLGVERVAEPREQLAQLVAERR